MSIFLNLFCHSDVCSWQVQLFPFQQKLIKSFFLVFFPRLQDLHIASLKYVRLSDSHICVMTDGFWLLQTEKGELGPPCFIWTWVSSSSGPSAPFVKHPFCTVRIEWWVREEQLCWRIIHMEAHGLILCLLIQVSECVWTAFATISATLRFSWMCRNQVFPSVWWSWELPLAFCCWCTREQRPSRLWVTAGIHLGRATFPLYSGIKIVWGCCY